MFLLYYRSFNPGQTCDYCHTHKTRQIYYQPEPNFWMVIVSISGKQNNYFFQNNF